MEQLQNEKELINEFDYNRINIAIYVRDILFDGNMQISSTPFINSTIKYDELIVIKKLAEKGYNIIFIDDEYFPLCDNIKRCYSLWNGVFKGLENKISYYRINNELQLYLKLESLDEGNNRCIYVGGRYDDYYPLTNKCFLGFAKTYMVALWLKQYYNPDSVNRLDNNYPIISLKNWLDSNIEEYIRIIHREDK